MIKRLSAIVGLVSLLWIPGLAVTKNKPFQEYNFSKGLDSYHNPQSLPQGFVQDANNVLFDDKAPITKRSGYQVSWSTKTYAFTNLWTYTDASNTTWLLARSSDQITANNLSGNMVVVATVSANNLIGEANAFGNAFFVDQTQGVYYWNGTSTTYIINTPKGSMITQFHNRLWVTGSAVPNGNQLYSSAYYAATSSTNWVTGLNPTDPVQVSIGLQDNFDNVTAEYVYLDTLYLFKHYSIFALYGFDQTSFQISQLTQECGCIDGGSIQTYNGGLKFLSLRGVEDFNGYSCKRISDPIKNKVDPAIQFNSFNQQSWIQQSQADFLAGTSTDTNATAVVNNVVLTTGTFTDTNFSGTTSNTRVVGGKLYLGISGSGTQNVTNNSFESGLSNWTASGYGTWSSVTCSDPVAACGGLPISGCDGSKAAHFHDTSSICNAYLEAIDLSNNVLEQVNITTLGTGCTMNGTTIGNTTYINKRVKFRVHVNCPGGDSYLTTNNSYLCDTYLFGSDTCGASLLVISALPFSSDLYVDDLGGGSNSISSGYYISPSQNTKLTSLPIVQMATFTVENTPTSPYFELQSSPDNLTWSTVGKSTWTDYTANTYIRYVSSITPGPSEDGWGDVSNASFIWTASSGIFTSQTKQINGTYTFGNFVNSVSLNGGTESFAVCSSANSNMSPRACSTVTSNSSIGTPTNKYVDIIDTFTVTNTSNTPALITESIQWNSGSLAPPLSSTIWDNRYWLSLATNSVDGINDAILVLDKDMAWSVFDIHAGGLTQYKNAVYHSDSNSTGNIYADNQGLSDNGSPINSYIRTRAFGLGDYAADDYLYAVYPSALNTGSCTMGVSYRMDGGGTSYTLGSPLLSEYGTMSSVRLPFPVDTTHQDFGQTIDFTIGTNDSQCDWQFYGLEGLFKSRPIQ